jgi:hypothetical protein
VDDITRQEIVDGEQLRILRMCFFVAAGLAAFAGLLGILYMFIGVFMFSAIPQMTQQSGQPEFPDFIGKFFGAFGLIFAVVFFTIAVLQFLTAQRLKARRSRTFCMVIAALTCLYIPVGTFLGICTLMVLGRESVLRTFHD